MNEGRGQRRGVLGSLAEAVGRLRRNPIILAGALIVIGAGGAVGSLGLLDPTVGSLGSLLWLFVLPFLFAGFLGMAAEARTGETGLNSFVSAGTSNYLGMLGATLLFAAVVLVVVIVSVLITLLVFFVAVAGAAGEVFGGGVTVALVVVGFLAFFVPYLFVYLFLQFYGVGIVAGGKTATSSFSHSFGLVRRNFLSTVGYTVLFFCLSVVGFGPGYAVLFLGGLEPTGAGGWTLASESLFTIGGVFTLTVGTLAMALAFTYQVTFYESISGVTENRPTEDNSFDAG